LANATIPEIDKECQAIVIGGGPAGLMAAEQLLRQGVAVDLFEAMPAVARKLLVAGQGGLNLTRAEPLADFLAHYPQLPTPLARAIRQFGPEQLRGWVAELGITTLVGSTGRVYPQGMGSEPLLAAWRQRLDGFGLRIHPRHHWQGWDERGSHLFATSEGWCRVRARATVFALGGGSWPQLGSTGSWVAHFQAARIATAQLQPANCGFDAVLSDHFLARHQGEPLKNVVLSCSLADGRSFSRRGELLVTATGLEGGLIYAAGPMLRAALAAGAPGLIHLDLCPDWPAQRLVERLQRPRGSRSLASHLEKTIGLKGVQRGLLYESVPRADFAEAAQLARWIKQLPVTLLRPRPLAEAISSAGGVVFSEVDDDLMLHRRPGTFCAGEMLDWEAPTGGYLLTACLATGQLAGRAAAAWLQAVAAEQPR
jgi:uncharacterized flavoprotein (TIGR03862 family)